MPKEFPMSNDQLTRPRLCWKLLDFVIRHSSVIPATTSINSPITPFLRPLLILWRGRDGEGDFLNSLLAHDVQHANDRAVRGVFIAADVHGQVCVDAKFIGENQV